MSEFASIKTIFMFFVSKRFFSGWCFALKFFLKNL